MSVGRGFKHIMRGGPICIELLLLLFTIMHLSEIFSFIFLVPRYFTACVYGKYIYVHTSNS